MMVNRLGSSPELPPSMLQLRQRVDEGRRQLPDCSRVPRSHLLDLPLHTCGDLSDVHHDEEVPLEELLGAKPAKGGIFASWFSGELREYYGEEVGYSELTDRAKVYRFEKGVFKGIGDIAVPEAVELRERLGLPKKKPEANQ